MGPAIIALTVVALLVAVAILSIVRDRKQGKSSCGGNCASCKLCHGAKNGACQSGETK